MSNNLPSQGGQLVHNAAKMMDAATTAKINSVLIFGDPNNGTAVGSVPASKTLVICHDGDNICQHGDNILQPHLTYSMNADQAAAFVASAAGMAGAAAGNGTGTTKGTGTGAGSAKPTGTTGMKFIA
jgi:hypothetical protein